MTGRLPAALGGAPSFADRVPLVRPTVPETPALVRRLQSILESGTLTNGPTVRQLEEAISERLGVHAVAVASCTAGLMLTYQALGVTGRVVMPSFTFSASAHAVVWAGGDVDFADVEFERGCLDPATAAPLLERAGALSATHVYGTPCEVELLQELADRARLPLVYDAAHALGSTRRGTPIGRFGSAEVFSLSPTKVVVAGEGGLVTTSDASLAETVRLGRDYGNPGDYDTRFPGLNARMSELHAAVALASLAHLDDHLAARAALVERFEAALAGAAGLRVIRPAAGDTSTFKDLTLVVDEHGFGLDAPTLQRALAAEGIDSRRYYSPPIHHQQAYTSRWPATRALPVTDRLAGSVISPPLWSHMTAGVIEQVAEAISRLHDHAPSVASALGSVR